MVGGAREGTVVRGGAAGAEQRGVCGWVAGTSGLERCCRERNEMSG